MDLAALRSEMLLDLNLTVPEFSCLSAAQMQELYRRYCAEGYPDALLPTTRERKAFVHWAVTPPIKEVYDAY